MEYKCFWCGKIIKAPNKGQKDRFRVTGRMYCSKECGLAYTSVCSSKTMASTNRKYASERMKLNNPMHRPGIKEKMISSLKAIHHKPIVRGGNGFMSEPQKKLFDELRKKYECFMEYPFPTKINKGNGYPTCYKIDIAIPDKMIAIEVDGQSHCSICNQLRDKKKDSFLTEKGWFVYHFTNNQVINNVNDCVRQLSV
jgi:hypothetical protein